MPGLTRRGVTSDALLVLGWFVVLGALCAVLWWRLTPLAEYTRTGDNAVMAATQFAKRIATDGWYVVIALVAGLLSGVVLSSWRRRDPLVTVVLLGLGSVLAAWLMLRLGLLLGPPEPGAVIRHVPTGGHAALQLKPLVHGVWLVWPIATMVGAAAVLFVLTPTPIDDDVTMTEPGEP